MANDLAGRPWTLDTPGTTVLWKGWVKIKNVEFTDYTADTDTAALQDQNGRNIVDFNGKADLSPVFSLELGWVNGLKLTALTAGKVKVFIQ